MLTVSADNVLGFMAILAYLATLLPSNLRAVFPALRPNHSLKSLLKYRRTIGIGTWLLAIAHIRMAIHHHKIAISTVDFYMKSMNGILLITIFGLLALTSNQWSRKKLKHRWKQLHQLTYVAAFLLPCHIIEKMSGGWTIATVAAIALLIPTLGLVFLRKYIQLAG
jgi:methionine sulfoxide reductase heme-binding subunit